jgi:tripartite ATP-independent transporter DctP family solute receptor
MKKVSWKRIVGLVICFAMVFSFVGCSKEQANDTAKQSTEQVTDSKTPEPEKKDATTSGNVITLRFSSASGPDDTHTKGMYKIKEVIEDLSGGQIKMELYLNSTLFAQDAETEAIMSGDLDMCYVSSQWVAAYVDEANMFTAMYLYKGADHLNKVLNGEIGKNFFQTVADKIGVLPLAAYYYGERNILMRSADKKIMTPKDLSGVIMRKPNTPEWLFVGEALGAKPTPLAFGEMYTAMQTGTVDACANPLPTIINNKLYEVGKMIVLTRHIVDSVWPSISVKTWNSFTEEQKGWMKEAIEAGRQVAEKAMLDQEKEAIDFLKSQGLIVVEPDVEAFREYALQKYIDAGKTKLWDMDLYKKIQEIE